MRHTCALRHDDGRYFDDGVRASLVTFFPHLRWFARGRHARKRELGNMSVENAVKKLDEAFNSQDLNAVLSFYEDDAVLVARPGQLIRGKENLRKFFRGVFASGLKARQEKTHVIENGDIALFLSRWTLSGQQFVATSIFKRSKNGMWRLSIDNSFGPAVLEQ